MNETVPNDQRKSPYQGLTPYSEADAAFFFGREKETKLITASLFASPLTVLYGPSGVGKSSILRAGVVKNLRERKDVLPIVFGYWQSDPFIELKISIAQNVLRLVSKQMRTRKNVKETLFLIEKIAEGHSPRRMPHIEPGYGGPLVDFITRCSKLIRRRLMIILDQFEEYSLYHPENDRFAYQLPRAIAITDLSVSFLLSLREDAVAQLDRFEGHIPTLFNNFRRVDHLDRQAARRAITEPIARYNELNKNLNSPVSIEQELVDQVLDQVGAGQVIVGPAAGAISTTSTRAESEGRIETPYLQLVMTRLWNQELNQGSSVLRVVTLSQLGGAQRIVLTHLDAVMAKFPDHEKELATKVFNQLVTPSGTKIAHLVRDLADYAGVISADLKPLLEKLSRGSDRILRPVAPLPEFPDEPRYEIFHDRLGPAILDWRSRYLHEQELLKAKLQEADQRRFSQSYVDKLMAKLDATELELTSQVLSHLITPARVRVVQPLKDLASFLNVTTTELASVMQKLCAPDDGILSKGFAADQQERYEVRHEALVPAILSWQAGYLDEQKRRQVGPTSDLRPGATSILPKYSGFPSAEPKNPPYQAISELLQRGRIVPFVGPGVSASARASIHEPWHEDAPFLPTSTELTRYLATLVEFPYEAGTELASLEMVASFVEAMAGRQFLNKLLHRALANTTAQPSATGRYLADVARSAPLFIVTSNYDDLLEQAFAEAKVAYDVLINVNHATQGPSLLWRKHGQKRAEPVSPNTVSDLKSRSVIYKLSGSIDRDNDEASTFVITDLDYLDGFVQRVTVQKSFIGARISEKNALLLGWSLRTWPNRGFLRSLLQYGRVRIPKNWSILFQPSPLEQAFCAQMNVELFNQDLNEFAGRMRHLQNAFS
jgi:hypothetical protein